MARKVAIEIHNVDPSGCTGYTVMQIKERGVSQVHNAECFRVVARNVDEGQLEDILTERQMAAFEQGEYKFKVGADALLDTFQYLA